MFKAKLLKSILIPTLGISAIGTIAAISTSCGNVIHVTDATLNKTSTTLAVGGTETLTATVLPEDATDKSVTWTSNNPSVVTVDSNGKITAVAEGTATIFVATHDGGKTATLVVAANDSIVHVTEVKLDKTSAVLDVGDTETLTATVLPEDVTDKSVIWASNNPSVITVDSNGKITAKAPGAATIFVATHDGGYTATCKVTVIAIHVTSVSLNKTSTTLTVGETETLTATVLPEDVTDKSTTWTSSNPSVATVDSNGKITAVAEGTATIFVTTHEGGKTATCDVTVNPVHEFIHIHIKSGNNGSVSKTDLTVDKNSTWGQIKSQITATPNLWFEVYEWIRVDKSGEYISEITDDYKFADDAYLKVLFNHQQHRRTGDSPVVATQESKWGDITVKYKLLDNHECRLLTEYGDADEEDGYVSGEGKIVIPDHVIYSMEPYYIREISSDWSSGENNITGFLFDNVKHLEAICDRAFFHTNALDYYTYSHDGYNNYCCFPEGLKTIGKEAFNGTSFDMCDSIYGYSFPSTLKSIGEMAFKYSPYIGFFEWGYLQFRSLVTIGEDAFWNTNYHHVEYVCAPTLDLAKQMTDILNATGDFSKLYPGLI